MLKGLVDPSKQLSEDQQAHIDSLQDEIDEIWNRRGDYQLDPDAWESMPIFMENITEEDIERNEYCAAMSSIVYDEVPPDEIAENRKEHGNRALNMALNPTQERRDNLARAACHSYTEALQAKGKDTKLSSTIYANRSLAQFIIGNYGHGLEDAQKAIILNPDYVKAYYRGAKCAERVRKYAVALDLLDKGLRVADPPPNEDTKREFAELQQICSGLLEKQNSKEATTKRTVRAQAAKISNMAHAISSFGIKISPIAEVTSDQMGVYGYPQPYFDTDRLLHVPILFMYDEFQQTDIMKDVACDCCLGELLEEMLPFPWDTQNRYDGLDNIVALYKIDDGVKMVEYYEIDLSWPLAEVFRCETYQMPKLLPVIHVLSRSSELLQRYSVHRLGE